MATTTPPSRASTDEERALREAVAGISRSFGPDYYQQQVDAGGHAQELWRALGEKGYLGVHLPEQYGGGGLGMRELAIVVEETAIAGVPLISVLFSPGVVGTILERSASEEQKHRWLPGVAGGEKRLSFAITEPDAGVNSHRIATVARRAGDGYVLSGQKVFISGIESADHVMVVCRTGTDEPTARASRPARHPASPDGSRSSRPAGRLSVLMVDTDSPGLSFQKIRTVMNTPDGTNQVFFDDVEVPAENLIGAEGDGLRVAFTGLNTERILTSSICTGIGRYALRKAVAYANERRVWSAPIGAHQAVAHPLAAAHIHIRAAIMVTDEACRRYDAGEEVGELANMCKYLGASAGLEALDAAVSVHGGNSVTYEYQLATYFWLVRMLNNGPVSKEMILNFVAEHSLGLPRSY